MKTRPSTETPVLGEPDSAASRLLLLAALPLLCAAGVGALIGPVSRWRGAGEERSIVAVAFLCVSLVAVAVAGTLILRRARPRPGELAAVVVAAVAVVLAGIYFYWVSSLLVFRADILLWSESEFVNDILKFRVGYPIFSAPANLDSFHYPPATQLLTYLIAWLSGHAISIPVYRIVQLGFALLAALVSVLTVRRIMHLGAGEGRPKTAVWIWAPVLLLVVTNARTNAFVHFLHDDALALLVSAVAYWLLLEYTESRQVRYLAAMALVPALGFWVKQSLAIWVVLYLGYLVFFDRPRSVNRVAWFGIAACGALFAAVGLGLWIWGPAFRYWIFTVLGNHPVAPLRSLQHLLTSWTYVAGVLVAGGWLLARAGDTRLSGPWFVSLALLAVELYTSGVAWMMNHVGPGSLIAATWMLAALTAAWPMAAAAMDRVGGAARWVVAGAAVMAAILLASGLQMIRIPRPGLPPDAGRYASAIEQEFKGGRLDRILLDAGTWVYLTQGVVVKDRSAAAGEAGYSGTADFSGMLSRIRGKFYEKILIRDLHADQFIYDYALWPRSSGIRQALLDNYEEVRRIPKVVGSEYDPPWFREISVLVPKP